MNNLSCSAFKQAYQSIVNFEESKLDDGRIRLFGANAYHGIALELIRSTDCTDALDFAHLHFNDYPHYTPPEKDATTFLSIFFSDTQHAKDWFDIAGANPPIFECEQDGIILRLAQFSPIPFYRVFNLSARPSEPVQHD